MPGLRQPLSKDLASGRTERGFSMTLVYPWRLDFNILGEELVDLRAQKQNQKQLLISCQ